MDHDFVAHTDKAITNAMRQAIALADMKLEDIGHIHAHGLGSKESDIAESSAIASVFAESKPDVPVVAAKANFGNLGAASGMVELVASLHAIKNGNLFGARNLTRLDSNCPINLVRDDSVAAGKTVLNVNATPQGQASAIIAGSFAA